MFASLKNRLKLKSSRAAAASGYGLDPNSLRYKLTNWLLTAPRAASLLALSVVLITCVIALLHIRSAGPTLFSAEETETELVFVYLRRFYFLGLGLLVPVLVLSFLRYRICNLVVPVAIASAAVFAIWGASEIFLRQPSTSLYHSGVKPALLPGLFRLVLVAGLILSPPVLVVLYRRAPILDRYLLRQFLGPFALCSVGILAVWVIYDLQDNISDFFIANASLGTVLHLYIIQLPQMIVMILPATLLLGLLYSLSKMSKSNEIVSMLSTGRSLVSILSPLLFVGAYASVFCFAVNYEWAPQAAAHKDSILDDIEEQRRINKDKGKQKQKKTVIKKEDIAIARNQVYPNREDNRLWRIRYIPLDLSAKKMSGIQIIQRDDEDRITKAIYADKAGWNHQTGEWFLRSGSQNLVQIFDFTDLTPEGVPKETAVAEHIESGWSETPWNIVSEHLVADHLGIPDLGFHLAANADKPAENLAPFRAHWHYRWSLPWSCFVVVMFAAPLGIGLSRRGVLGGVAAAISLFFCMLFLSHLFLVLAQSQIVPAIVGAWTTNLLLLVIGLYLIYMRSMNRDLPKLTPAGIVSMIMPDRSSSRAPRPAAAPALDAAATAEDRRSRRKRTTQSSTKRTSGSESDLDFD